MELPLRDDFSERYEKNLGSRCSTDGRRWRSQVVLFCILTDGREREQHQSREIHFQMFAHLSSKQLLNPSSLDTDRVAHRNVQEHALLGLGTEAHPQQKTE